MVKRPELQVVSQFAESSAMRAASAAEVMLTSKVKPDSECVIGTAEAVL
jgi:hypothetical protein